MAVKVIKPTWQNVSSGLQLSREGTVLLEFADVLPGATEPRKYDWEQKLVRAGEWRAGGRAAWARAVEGRLRAAWAAPVRGRGGVGPLPREHAGPAPEPLCTTRGCGA